MATKWYAIFDDQQVGPFSSADFRTMAQENRLTPETKVRKEGMQYFVLAAEVKGLFAETDFTQSRLHATPEQHTEVKARRSITDPQNAEGEPTSTVEVAQIPRNTALKSESFDRGSGRKPAADPAVFVIRTDPQSSMFLFEMAAQLAADKLFWLEPHCPKAAKAALKGYLVGSSADNSVHVGIVYDHNESTEELLSWLKIDFLPTYDFCHAPYNSVLTNESQKLEECRRQLTKVWAEKIFLIDAESLDGTPRNDNAAETSSANVASAAPVASSHTIEDTVIEIHEGHEQSIEHGPIECWQCDGRLAPTEKHMLILETEKREEIIESCQSWIQLLRECDDMRISTILLGAAANSQCLCVTCISQACKNGQARKRRKGWMAKLLRGGRSLKLPMSLGFAAACSASLSYTTQVRQAERGELCPNCYNHCDDLSLAVIHRGEDIFDACWLCRNCIRIWRDCPSRFEATRPQLDGNTSAPACGVCGRRLRKRGESPVIGIGGVGGLTGGIRAIEEMAKSTSHACPRCMILYCGACGPNCPKCGQTRI